MSGVGMSDWWISTVRASGDVGNGCDVSDYTLIHSHENFMLNSPKSAQGPRSLTEAYSNLVGTRLLKVYTVRSI